MSLGRLALRSAVGGLFIGHGTQKLFGWFDGYGLEPTAQMFGSLGLRPAKAPSRRWRARPSSRRC
jgi:putative oxidoreductase